MYFLQEAIAAAPFLLIAFIAGVVMIIVIGYALYTWARKRDDAVEEAEQIISQSQRSTKREGSVIFIIVVVLMILILAGCGWLCGIKYG